MHCYKWTAFESNLWNDICYWIRYVNLNIWDLSTFNLLLWLTVMIQFSFILRKSHAQGEENSNMSDPK